MILTDLSIDCIEGILEHLEFEDLLNVADSNERLRHASKFVFTWKYGGYQFNFENARINRTSGIRLLSKDHEIWIIKLNTSLQVLRIFGAIMSRIKYSGKFSIPLIIDYINDYCKNTLKDIEISRDRLRRLDLDDLDEFNGLKNPFLEVESVSVDIRSGLLVLKSSLAQLFPKIQKLYIVVWKGDYSLHNGSIDNHFPFLKHFGLNFKRSTRHHEKEYVELVKSFLILNPQLKSLRIRCDGQDDLNIIQYLAENHGENLERLELYPGEIIDNFDGEKFYLKTVKHLWIHKYNFASSIRIPFSFDHLESFEIFLIGSLNENVYDFLGNNLFVRKLSIMCWHGEIDFFQLAQYLPVVEEIINYSDILSIEKVIQVIGLFKTLKMFQFLSHEYNEYEQLPALLNHDWSMECKTMQFKYIILKRRM